MVTEPPGVGPARLDELEQLLDLADEPGGATCVVDDLAVADRGDWARTGPALLAAVRAWAAGRGAAQLVVVAAHLDEAKRGVLADAGLDVASEWWVASVTGAPEPRRTRLRSAYPARPAPPRAAGPPRSDGSVRTWHIPSRVMTLWLATTTVSVHIRSSPTTPDATACSSTKALVDRALTRGLHGWAILGSNQ